MDKKNPKWRIVIEGLILLGYILFVIIFISLTFERGFNYAYNFFANYSELRFYVVLSYPIYLLIRFIIWALRTLKKK